VRTRAPLAAQENQRSDFFTTLFAKPLTIQARLRKNSHRALDRLQNPVAGTPPERASPSFVQEEPLLLLDDPRINHLVTAIVTTY